MVSAKPKLSLTVALGRADFSSGSMMLMLCGDLISLMEALIISFSPLVGVCIVAALVIIKIDAHRRDRTAALPLDISRRSR
jgi:hypothetical protein